MWPSRGYSQPKLDLLFPKLKSDSVFAYFLINYNNCSAINFQIDDKIAEQIESKKLYQFKVISNSVTRKKEMLYYRRLWKLKENDLLICNDDSLSYYLKELIKENNLISKWNSCVIIRKKKKIFKYDIF